MNTIRTVKWVMALVIIAHGRRNHQIHPSSWSLHDSASYSVSTKKYWAVLFHVSSRGDQHPNNMQGELCVCSFICTTRIISASVSMMLDWQSHHQILTPWLHSRSPLALFERSFGWSSMHGVQPSSLRLLSGDSLDSLLACQESTNRQKVMHLKCQPEGRCKNDGCHTPLPTVRTPIHLQATNWRGFSLRQEEDYGCGAQSLEARFSWCLQTPSCISIYSRVYNRHSGLIIWQILPVHHISNMLLVL